MSLNSHHPAAHKKVVARTLMSRVEALSSSGVSCSQEEKHVAETLKRNGYSTRKGFIHKHTCLQPNYMSLYDHETSASLTLSYFNGLSESICRVLAPLAIQVTFRLFRIL